MKNQLSPDTWPALGLDHFLQPREHAGHQRREGHHDDDLQEVEENALGHARTSPFPTARHRRRAPSTALTTAPDTRKTAICDPPTVLLCVRVTPEEGTKNAYETALLGRVA